MRVLFVCVGNSGRSQMAEAFARALSGGAVEAESAGTAPADALDPAVAAAMNLGNRRNTHQNRRGMTRPSPDAPAAYYG